MLRKIANILGKTSSMLRDVDALISLDPKKILTRYINKYIYHHTMNVYNILKVDNKGCRKK